MMSLLCCHGRFLSVALCWTSCGRSAWIRTGPQTAPGRQSVVLIYVCGLVSTVLIVERAVLACTAYAIGGWVGTTWPSTASGREQNTHSRQPRPARTLSWIIDIALCTP